MKTPTAILLAFHAILSAAPGQDWTPWQWEASYELPQGGMMRIEVPPAVLDLSRPDLGDLRLLSPAGVETPYLVDLPRPREIGVRNAAGFKVALVGNSTVIEVSSGIPGAIEGIELVSPAPEFLKSVSVEDGNVSESWGKLADNEVIFRQQPGEAERLRIALPTGPRKSLRITVNDDRSPPIPFTGIRLRVAAEDPVIESLPVALRDREEVARQTRLTLDLGASNLNVAELRFEIPDAVFSRKCELTFSSLQAGGESRTESLGSGVLYRVVGDRGISTEHLVIPVNRRVAARYLVATVSNGDSPPLTITAGRIGIYPTVLGFFASQAGEYRLLTGHREANPPAYDLDPLRGVLAPARGRYPAPDSLKEKADFQKPPALPGVESAGAGIDLTEWSRRRRVNFTSPRVIQIELDAAALAGSQLGIGDLRLIQNGQQIPYLIKPATVIRELTPAMIQLPDDPELRTSSRWELTLPVDGLPAFELTANSPAQLFSRRFEAFSERKDELGNAWTENIGAAEWSKSGRNDNSLTLPLAAPRLPRRIQLQTNHGDNPPIQLVNPRLCYRAPSIIAKITGSAPLFVVYGNPKAKPPRYDLRLVEKDLLATEPQATVLGDEEILRPVAPGPKSLDAGSPWLWVALAGVVAALLVIVAKLLPSPVTD